MNDTLKSTQQLNLCFTILVCLNFLIIVFMASVMMISIENITVNGDARSFLDILTYAPRIATYKIITRPLISFTCILVCIHQCYQHRDHPIFCFYLIVFELISSAYIMYCLGLSSNSIMLLVIAHIFYSYKSVDKMKLLMGVSVTLYILSNFSILYGIQVIPFRAYLQLYNAMGKMLLTSLYTMLNAGNVVVFVVFMYFMIRKENSESKKVMELNDELLTLNLHLQEYAILQKKAGETQERNRLAREIHDTLGHTLTGLSVGIDAAIMILDIDSETTKQQLAVLSETARQGLKDVRRSVEKLRPDALERFSLQDALEKMIQDFKMASNVKVNFICHLENLYLSKEEDEVVYRIIQEGMTNAVRHGKATEIFITLSIEGDHLIIIIEDNGIGCEEIKYGFGLHHMEERLRIINGSLRAYGSDGFIIIAEIPLRKEVKNNG